MPTSVLTILLLGLLLMAIVAPFSALALLMITVLVGFTASLVLTLVRSVFSISD